MADEFDKLARDAVYVGSGQHKDVPGMGLMPARRAGAMTMEQADRAGIDNPDCTLCPRKWARRHQDAATKLLQAGIRSGQVSFDAAPGVLPKKVWVRDPEEENVVYEARLLSAPPNGYKAYPLTTRQSGFLPILVR